MKHCLFSSLASAVVFAFSVDAVMAGVPEPAAPKKPPATEKPAPEPEEEREEEILEAPPVEKPANALQAKAAAVVEESILKVLRKKTPPSPPFSRAIHLLPIYRFASVASGPNDIKLSAEVQPFQIVDHPWTAKSPKTIVLSGYYDAKINGIMLYNQTTKAYVAPSEHPFIKAKLALQ